MRASNIHKSGAGRTTQQYFGNYLGIVVQNNDPDKRGRVKVYVPHIAPGVYANWDEAIKDKKFKFPGENIDSDLNIIIDDLKEYLPWADCAAPLVGASGSGRYNAHIKAGSISDSNTLQSFVDDKSELDDAPLNTDGIGEKPARQYEVHDYRLTDAFTTTKSEHTGTNFGAPKNVNKYSHNYIPKSYSNSAKGTFSIPNVGSHVWIFFKGGNPMAPVYFAVSFGTEDWQAIYESEEGYHGKDYPGTYENKSGKEDPLYDHNTETYRNKYVLNQKGGTFEIVNTDKNEVLKMTHYSGSFKEFNNHTNIELATHNDQKLVLGHQFSTVRGSKNEFVEQDYDTIIRGDFYKKIGNFNIKAFQEWKDLAVQLADVKQRFEIKRAKYTESENVLFQKVAPGSVIAGVYANCPVCTHDGRMPYWEVKNNGLTFLNTPVVQSTTEDVYGSYVSPRGDTDSFEFLRPPANPTNFLGSGNCPCCGGSGTSPSTQDGRFDSEDKDLIIGEQLKQIIGDLTVIEKDMGLGGSDITHITKHKVETIGLMMNDFPSVRIDDAGKINYNEVIIRRGGVVTNMKESPLVEYVHVDSLPGGDYTLNVCNKFNCSVGAGGISFKTFGPVDIGGTITNIAGEQVNIMSDNEVNIVSNRVNIVADILSLRQKKYKQVLVDSNLGVSQNVIIGGGLHVEGELTCNHITAPMEIQETEQTTLYAASVPGKVIGQVVGVMPGPATLSVVGTGREEDCILCYDHSHQFKNVPLHLMQTSDDVRSIAEDNNKEAKNAPAPVENQCKGGGLGQTGETYSI